MNIELHIERLVLDGIAIPPGHGEKLRDSISAELVSLLRDGGLASSALSAGTTGCLRAAPVGLTVPGSAAELGKSLGGAIYEGLSR